MSLLNKIFCEMRSISKTLVIEYLELMIDKSNLVIERNKSIVNVHDFLISPERMEKFDAACMLIQVIGETAKKIDDWTSSNLFCNYPDVYWRGVFGCRNIISHEYGNVDSEQIFIIMALVHEKPVHTKLLKGHYIIFP